MAKVKVYFTQMCPYCTTLKEFLKERHVEFEEVDVTEDEAAQKEMIEKSGGQMEVPIIEIDDQVVVGFNREKIIKLLKLKE